MIVLLVMCMVPKYSPFFPAGGCSTSHNFSGVVDLFFQRPILVAVHGESVFFFGTTLSKRRRIAYKLWTRSYRPMQPCCLFYALWMHIRNIDLLFAPRHGRCACAEYTESCAVNSRPCHFSVLVVRGEPDDTWEGAMGFFPLCKLVFAPNQKQTIGVFSLKKKVVQQKVMKK